ncbi:unnamed protein product, partial [Allacma fusca]
MHIKLLLLLLQRQRRFINLRSKYCPSSKPSVQQFKSEIAEGVRKASWKLFFSDKNSTDDFDNLKRLNHLAKVNNAGTKHYKNAGLVVCYEHDYNQEIFRQLNQ